MKKIAVVEDEEYMRDELCTMLKRAGYATWRLLHLKMRWNR